MIDSNVVELTYGGVAGEVVAVDEAGEGRAGHVLPVVLDRHVVLA